jgi:hypothetical protein
MIAKNLFTFNISRGYNLRNIFSRRNIRNTRSLLNSQSKDSSFSPPEQSDKYLISFTCNKCNTTTSKMISKQGYHHGIVIAICDGCQSKHLIADRLGWFKHAHSKDGVISTNDKAFDLENVVKNQNGTFVKGNIKKDEKP